MFLKLQRTAEFTKKEEMYLIFLREKKASVYCLQDTHLLNSDDASVHTQWGFDNILCQGKNDARGVMNLFLNNFEYKLLRTKKDDKGNLLVVEIEVCNKMKITLVNIYGPNKDEPSFFENIHDTLCDFDNDFVLVCGDWNLTQDYDKDCFNYVSHNYPNSRSVVEKLKENFNLVDPWRIFYPDKRIFTWHRTNPVKQARLDFFLISNELMSLVNSVQILPGYRTDHSYIELELKISDFDKGPGFWRFNNSLLKEKDYVDLVKHCILETKKKITSHYPLLKI